MFGTASNLLVQAELARIDASVAYDRPDRFLLGLLRGARLRRLADDVAIVLEPTGQQITQSFPEPVPSIVDRLLQTSELVLQGGCAANETPPFAENEGDGNAKWQALRRRIASGRMLRSGVALRVCFTCRLQKNETPGPGPRFPRSCGRHRAE